MQRKKEMESAMGVQEIRLNDPAFTKINFGAVRDLGQSLGGKSAYLVSDSDKSEADLPDGVAVKYAFVDATRVGIIANGEISADFVKGLLLGRKGQKEFKVWRMNGSFDKAAFAYTLDLKTGRINTQTIDFTGVQGPDVIFDDDYQPYGVGKIGRRSVTRSTTTVNNG